MPRLEDEPWAKMFCFSARASKVGIVRSSWSLGGRYSLARFEEEVETSARGMFSSLDRIW